MRKLLDKILQLGDPSSLHFTQNVTVGVLFLGVLSSGIEHPRVGHGWSVST
jgi:hypothetical protein